MVTTGSYGNISRIDNSSHTVSVAPMGDALMRMLHSGIAYLPDRGAAIIIRVISWRIGRIQRNFILKKIVFILCVYDAHRRTSSAKAIA